MALMVGSCLIFSCCWNRIWVADF